MRDFGLTTIVDIAVQTTQMAEHKTHLEQQKRGEPGTKDAEVFLLQEAMENSNKNNVSENMVLTGPAGSVG